MTFAKGEIGVESGKRGRGGGGGEQIESGVEEWKEVEIGEFPINANHLDPRNITTRYGFKGGDGEAGTPRSGRQKIARRSLDAITTRRRCWIETKRWRSRIGGPARTYDLPGVGDLITPPFKGTATPPTKRLCALLRISPETHS